MSRMPIRIFLKQAKQVLEKSLRERKEAQFVIGNESADLDSVTSALVYSYVQSSAYEAVNADKLWIPVTNVPAVELRLRTELSALLKHADLTPSDLITLDDLKDIKNIPKDRTSWTLVDHNVFQGELGDRFGDRVVGVIDHHADEGVVPSDANPRVIDKTGSCCSHVTNLCSKVWDEASRFGTIGNKGRDSDTNVLVWDAQVAKLALAPILIDTINLKATDKVTSYDTKAVDYLEGKIKASPEEKAHYNRNSFFEEINNAKSNLDSLDLEEILRKDYKQWQEGDLTLGISSCVRSIKYLQDKGDLMAAISKYGQSRKLDIFALMTAHNDSSDFSRQVLIAATGNGKGVDAVNKFIAQQSNELQLNESGEQPKGDFVLLQSWEQKNLTASRKQIAPMLREAMKQISSRPGCSREETL